MISIIVPVYNSEDRLSKCINSIIKQTYKNIEIILVDDGSTDKSAEICDFFADKDERIKVYHLSNSGVSSARNFGINKSNGSYIMFCDSDDTVEEDWCKELRETIEMNPFTWISCGYSKVDVNGVVSNSVIINSKKHFSNYLINDYFEIYKTGSSGYLWNKIYDAKIIKDNNILFSEETDYAEDALFNNEYLKYCQSICFINKSLYNYYVSDNDSLSSKYYSDYYDKVKPVYLSRLQYISEEHIPEFCYDYFYHFNKSLKGTFDKRNKISLMKKIKYNNYIINDSVFKECISMMTKKDSDQKYISMLNKGNYFKIYLLEKLSFVKKIIKR